MGKCTCHFLSWHSSPFFLSSSSECTPKSQSWVHSEVPTLKPNPHGAGDVGKPVAGAWEVGRTLGTRCDPGWMMFTDPRGLSRGAWAEGHGHHQGVCIVAELNALCCWEAHSDKGLSGQAWSLS